MIEKIKTIIITITILYASQFEYLLTTYRNTNNLYPLTQSKHLDHCAKKRAAQVWIFYRDTGTVSHRNWREPYCHVIIHGENLAQGFTTTQALQNWIKSPKHNDNLLSDRYRTFGIGSFQDITVQVFQ